MNYDDTSKPHWFEIDPKQGNEVTAPMGADGLMELLRDWRSKGWTAQEIMAALKKKGVKGITQKGIEDFLAG